MPHPELTSVRASLVSLQTKGDSLKKKLITEKQRVTRLELQLKESNEMIERLRESNKNKAVELMNVHNLSSNRWTCQKADGIDPTRVAEVNQNKLISSLEDRLNKALVRRNTIEMENDAIKANIDKLRYQIQNDTRNQDSMTRQLNSAKEDIQHLKEKAASVSEQRDKVLEKTKRLLNEDWEERNQFSKEYQALGEFISEQKIILENSITSMTSNMLTKLRIIDGATGNSRDDGKLHENTTQDSPVDETRAIDERLAYLDQRIETYKHIIRPTGDTKLFEEKLKELKQNCGVTNLDDLVKVFLRNEEEYFSLFNYIQSVNQEYEKVLEKRAALDKEVELYSENQRIKEEHRRLQVEECQRQLGIVENEGKKYREMVREGKTTIVHIANKVQALYMKLNCSELEGEDSSGDGNSTKMNARNKSLRIDRKMTMFFGEEISDRNILHRMELIEKRSIQLISEYLTRVARSKNRQRRLSIFISPKTFDKSFSTYTTDSTTFQVSDDDDEEDENNDEDEGESNRPVSVHDMRLQVAQRMKNPELKAVDF